MTTEVQIAAVVLGIALIIVLSIKIATGVVEFRRVVVWIASAAVFDLLITAAILASLLRKVTASPSSGGHLAGGDALAIAFLPLVFGPLFAAGVIPLAVLLAAAVSALRAARKGRLRSETAADAVTACIIPVIVIYVVMPPLTEPPTFPTHSPKSLAVLSRSTVGTLEPPQDFPRALAVAASRADVQTVRSLLEKGAPADERDSSGYTPLIAAVLARAPLYGDKEAFERNQLAVVDDLLNAGADVTAKDPSGKTALDHANQRGLTKIIALLERVRPAAGRGTSSR